MAINKKLIHFKTKENFNREVANNNILESSICFIQDTKEIYTHGQLYDGSTFDPSKIEESIENIINTKVDKSDIYYFDVDGSEEGVITIEEYEKIKKCSVLIERILVNEQIGYAISYTYKLDVTILGGDGLMFTTIVTNGEYLVFVGIVFQPNEDGNVTYSKMESNLVFNFKTINGESILGEGDIVIEGGSAYSEVNHGTSDTTFTLTPNTFHVWDEITTLDLDFGTETEGVANEYLFQFTSGATATTLTLPDSIKWANDSIPTISENMIYQISVLKGLASVLEFSNVSLGSFTVTSYQSWTFYFELGMTWDEWVNSEYNPTGYKVANNLVWQNSNYYLMNVSPSDSIIDGSSYTLKYYD